MDNRELSQIHFNGLKSGNNKIIREIYETYFPPVKKWIQSNNGTEDDALDTFQNVLIDILTEKEKVDRNFGGLIFQMCRYRWIDELRKRKRRPVVSIDDRIRLKENDSIGLEEIESNAIRFSIADKAFNALSDMCKKILNLIKEGSPADEIVNKLNLNNKNTLYRRKHACIERWTKLVSEDPNYKQL